MLVSKTPLQLLDLLLPRLPHVVIHLLLRLNREPILHEVLQCEVDVRCSPHAHHAAWTRKGKSQPTINRKKPSPRLRVKNAKLTSTRLQHDRRPTARTRAFPPLLHLHKTPHAEEVPAVEPDGAEGEVGADEAAVVVERGDDGDERLAEGLKQFAGERGWGGGEEGE